MTHSFLQTARDRQTVEHSVPGLRKVTHSFLKGKRGNEERERPLAPVSGHLNTWQVSSGARGNRQDPTERMRVCNLLQPLLILLLGKMSMGESTGSVCQDGWQWSNDLGKCKDCKICDTSSKDDFCQTCDNSAKHGDFPWLLVISVTAAAVFVITLILSLTIYLARCRPKKKFTTPIEETGAHSAEALLIH